MQYTALLRSRSGLPRLGACVRRSSDTNRNKRGYKGHCSISCKIQHYPKPSFCGKLSVHNQNKIFIASC
jgi:hypothetical protein